MTATLPATSVSYETAMFTAKNAPANIRQIGQTAKEFESMFVSEMLSHMFAGLETDPVFGGGHGEDMFRSMLVTEYGKEIAKGPGLGISDQIQKMMIEMQQHNPNKRGVP